MRRRLSARARAFLKAAAGESLPFVVPFSIERELLAARCITLASRDVKVARYGATVIELHTLTPRGLARALTLVEGSPERLRTLRPPRASSAKGQTRGGGAAYAEVLANATKVAEEHALARRLSNDMLTRMHVWRCHVHDQVAFPPSFGRRVGFAPAGHAERMQARLEVSPEAARHLRFCNTASRLWLTVLVDAVGLLPARAP